MQSAPEKLETVERSRSTVTCGMLAYHNLLDEGGYRVRVLSALRELAARPLPGGASVKFCLIGFEGIRPFFSSEAASHAATRYRGDVRASVALPYAAREASADPDGEPGNRRHAHGSSRARASDATRACPQHARRLCGRFGETDRWLSHSVRRAWCGRRKSESCQGACAESQGSIACICGLSRLPLRGPIMSHASARRCERYLKPAARASVVPCCVAAPLSDGEVARRREQARERLQLNGRKVIGYLGSAAAWQQGGRDR